ncbi:MAG: hypothetical protein Q8R53_02295 [Nanoarchaeota archaeon]|nr:hypothetical protein [Nanoarchaeota archaeon]
MNKKAIMLKFLVTVVLAIFIFIPACLFVTKTFFRLSAQGEDSFRDLVNEVKDVAEAAEGEQRTFVLKMDAGNVVAAFTIEKFKLFSLRKGSDIQVAGVDPGPDIIYIETESGLRARELELPGWAALTDLVSSFPVDVSFFLSPPVQACQTTTAPCLCLCQEITQENVQMDPRVGRALGGSVDLRCESSETICRPLSSVEFPRSWGIARLTESDPRRIPLRITKEAGKVIIEELS